MPASHTHSVPAGFLDGKDDAQTRAIPVLLLQQTHPVFAKRLDSELFFAALADRDATKDCRATLRYLRFWVLRRLYWVAVFCDGRSGFNECGARWTVVTAFRHPSPLLRREGEPVAVAGREPAAGLALVGDAAFCPSLLAGQGSALAMIGAYVLAGELGRAGRSPEEAFRRYERLLQTFMLTKQNAAEKFASSFAPKTRLGLFARNQVTKVLDDPLVTRRVMSSTLLDRINLPDYSENTGP